MRSWHKSVNCHKRGGERRISQFAAFIGHRHVFWSGSRKAAKVPRSHFSITYDVLRAACVLFGLRASVVSRGWRSSSCDPPIRGVPPEPSSWGRRPERQMLYSSVHLMKLGAISLSLVIAAVLAFAAPWVHAQDGLQGALSRDNLGVSARLALPLQQTLAVADFDGDDKPDGAVLIDEAWPRSHGGVRTVELHFTGRGNTNLTFESNESALGISAQDVNHDGTTDIVVEQPFTHKRLQVWLNDGHGAFQNARSEDYPASESAYHGRGASSQHADSPAVCLATQRGHDYASPTGCASLQITGSRTDQQLLGASLLRSRGLARNPSRAPPISL